MPLRLNTQLRHCRPDREKWNLEFGYQRPQCRRFIPGAIVLAILLNYAMPVPAGADEPERRRVAAGEVFRDEVAGYQFTVRVGGWTLVPKGTVGTDSELEFTSGLESNWAVVFAMEGEDMADRSYERVNWIRSRHPNVECEESRKLADSGAYLVGSLLCRGANFLDGQFRYLSRVVSDGKRSVELFIFVTDVQGMFRASSKGYLKLADGLELL